MCKRLVCIACVLAAVLLIGCGGQIIRPMPKHYTTEDLHRLAMDDLELAELGALEPKPPQTEEFYVGRGKTNRGRAVKVDVRMYSDRVVFSAYAVSDGHVVNRVIRSK